MKKIFLLIAGFAFLAAGAQTVDEVIQKYATNLGGLEAFNKIKTAVMTGSFSVQGQDFPMTVSIINGKAVKTEIDINGSQIVNVYNNGKGWTINPLAGKNSATELSAAELNGMKPQSSLASTLMDYKARGHQVELMGQEDVEGVKAFKIKLTSKDDAKVSFFYINTSDYNMLKSSSEREIQGQTVTVETFYSNLKEFGGVKFYMTRDSKIDGETIQSTTFTNVELNKTLDEKLFDMPK